MWHRLATSKLVPTVCALLLTTALAELIKEPLLKPLKSTAQRIAEHGYPVEKHAVVTEDGYILTLFRIPHSHRLQQALPDQPIVLILHGLFCTSDCWVLNGPNDALPFLLADAGFDVWLGNARGNHYSRNHTVQHEQHPSFWHFSWHEIGHHDLAAMLDYVLASSGQQQQQSLHYVGHSQGTTSFFAFLATRPYYNKRIRTAHMLAPVAYIGNASSVVMRLLSPYLGHDSTYTRFFAHQEFMPYNELLVLLLFNTCGTQGFFYELCSRLIPWLPMMHEMHRHNETIVNSFADVLPGGASTNQILHYMQGHQSGEFCRFDYGQLGNLKIYGQLEPPAYELENITAHLHLWYSDNDGFAALEDVLMLAARLPNRQLHHMDDPMWGHGEFLYSWHVRELINEPILKIMQEYEIKNL